MLCKAEAWWIQQESEPKPGPIHRPARVRKREQPWQEKLAKLKAEAEPDAESVDPSKIRIQSEVSVIKEVKTFSSCPVPLNVTVNREIQADGH